MASPHIRVSASAVIVRDGHLLLVKFHDESGPHYNLPGGGADAGETAEDACVRETLEETGAVVTVGRLLLVREYEPYRCRSAYGKRHKLNLVFECHLLPDSEPQMPIHPDENQVGVEWMPLHRLTEVDLVSATLPGHILAALGVSGAPHVTYSTEAC